MIMKSRIILGLLLIPMLISLGGCAEKNIIDETPVRIIFNRTHGSVWGAQLYMDICPEEITTARYFTDRSVSWDQQYSENVPITEEQWNAVEAAVNDLRPLLEEVKKPSLLKRIISSRHPTVDGPLTRRLTLVFETGDELLSIEYDCPHSDQTTALEQLLEELAALIDETNSNKES